MTAGPDVVRSRTVSIWPDAGDRGTVLGKKPTDATGPVHLGQCSAGNIVRYFSRVEPGAWRART